jgi:hypothetical protein
VGLGIDDPVWVPTVFTKNRDRLLTTDIAASCSPPFWRTKRTFIVSDKRSLKAVKPLLSDEHFSVDGTLIQAWASLESCQPGEEAGGSEPPAGGDVNRHANLTP